MPPLIQFEDRSLPHVLTFEERERKGSELAHAIDEVNRIDAESTPDPEDDFPEEEEEEEQQEEETEETPEPAARRGRSRKETK